LKSSAASAFICVHPRFLLSGLSARIAAEKLARSVNLIDRRGRND